MTEENIGEGGTHDMRQAARLREERHRRHESVCAHPEVGKMDDGKWGLVRDPVKVATCRMARKTLRAAHRKEARRVEFKEGSGEMEVSDRVLRVRPSKPQPTRTVPRRDGISIEDEDEGLVELRNRKAMGYQKVTIGEGTIPGAWRGLFGVWRLGVGATICEYRGIRVDPEVVQKEGYEGKYVFEVRMKGVRVCIDAKEELSCYGRYINDPLDESLLNAKAVVRGGRLMIVATEEIRPGDEIFLSYGSEYWMDRLEKLSGERAEEIRAEEDRRQRCQGVQPRTSRKTGGGKPQEGGGAAEDPRGRAKKVRTAAEQQTVLEKERYAYDNIIQSAELAEVMQYLVGRKYMDDENGKTYEVEKIWFSASACAVVGIRRSLDGQVAAMDNDCFYVHGPMGLLQLTELYYVGEELEDEVTWPQDHAQWMEAQARDSQLGPLVSSMAAGETREVGNKMVVRCTGVEEGVRLLFRRQEADGQVWYQVLVPEVLRGKMPSKGNVWESTQNGGGE